MRKELQAFIDADNNINLSELSDDELKDYYTTVYNGSLDSMREMHKRGI